MQNDRLISTNETGASTVTSLIKIEGEKIPGTFQVLSIAVNKEVNRIPYAKIFIADGDASKEDFPASNEDLFIPGKEIEILVGYEANEDLIFKGIIVKHGIKVKAKGESILKLDCRDKAFRTSLDPKNRYFTESTDTDAIQEILSEYELSSEFEDTEVSHSELVQFESSDWNFLLSRVEANGKCCVVDDGKVIIQTPSLDAESLLTVQFGASLLEFDAEIDARHQFKTLKASTWDAVNQEVLEVEAAEPNIEGGGNLDADTLAETGGAESIHFRHGGNLAQDELQAWADARLLNQRLSKVQGRAKFKGIASLKPGNIITLAGVGDRFNGKVYVSGIRQEVNGGEWHTHAQLGISQELASDRSNFNVKPNQGLMPAIPGLQIGVVSQLEEDPEGEFRILVKLPIINPDEEGTWARIASLDAGENRGSFFLPDIGDEVIVGFVFGNPRDAVVLGMLHSSAKPAPLEASDDNYIKGFVSKGEMKILFDDEKNILHLETASGNKISLDEDQGGIYLEDENSNKIVMDSSGITIESSGDLILKAGGNLQAEGGANTELKAGANFKAEGTAGVELSTSAIAVVKGSLVQIN